MGELTIYPGRAVLLPPRYYGSVEWYAVAGAFGRAYADYGALFDKREKAAHRCTIADKEGATTLTAPIAKPHGIARATWRDVAMSDHGAWWHVQRVTLESAYGRSPFFEYYIDRFLPFLSEGVTERYPTLFQLLTAIDAEMRSCLAIDPDPATPPPAEALSYDEARAMMTAPLPRYWQVREQQLGFIGHLSALDLIFNLGPEAPLYLRDAIKACFKDP